jgi:hypothetical protein
MVDICIKRETEYQIKRALEMSVVIPFKQCAPEEFTAGFNKKEMDMLVEIAFTNPIVARRLIKVNNLSEEQKNSIKKSLE